MRKLLPIITNEKWQQYYSLKEHSDNVVSTEARATHIARAYLRGKDFPEVLVNASEWLESKRYNNSETKWGEYGLMSDREAKQKAAIKRASVIVERYKKGCKVETPFDLWVS